jgi:hypothetical protein
MNYELGDLRFMFGDRSKLTKELDKYTILNPATGKRTPKPAAAPEPPQTKAQELFQGQNNPKKQKHKKKVRIEQWVEITMENGVVKTELFPSNEVLIKEGQAKWPPPEIVYRRLNFVDGIPDVYAWAGIKDENHRKWGGCGLQRMTVDTWLAQIEEEAQRTDGHLSPVINLARPVDAGECSCEACQRGYKYEEENVDITELMAELRAAQPNPDLRAAAAAAYYLSPETQSEPETK